MEWTSRTAGLAVTPVAGVFLGSSGVIMRGLAQAPASQGTTGQFEAGFGPDKRGLSLKTARTDLAEFLEQQTPDPQHLHTAAAIQN